MKTVLLTLRFQQSADSIDKALTLADKFALDLMDRGMGTVLSVSKELTETELHLSLLCKLTQVTLNLIFFMQPGNMENLNGFSFQAR